MRRSSRLPVRLLLVVSAGLLVAAGGCGRSDLRGSFGFGDGGNPFDMPFPGDGGRPDGSILPDGGRTDGGRVDGGRTDGGRVDGGRNDGGRNDGGRNDGGRNDGGRNDGGRNDGGRNDGGRNDGGRNDGGRNDGGRNDGGRNDGGRNDGGRNDGGRPDGGFDGGGPRENCTNFRDDDGDGLTDCDDPDCFAHPSCRQPGQEICNNGIDDDDNGLVDCDDPACAGQPVCRVQGEICNNGIDDDGDGAIDCNDPECQGRPECQNVSCRPEVDFGTVQAQGTRVTRRFSTSGHRDAVGSRCVAPGGGDVVTTFDLAARADVRIDWQQSGDHSFALLAAGVGQACDANPRTCVDTDGQASGNDTFFNLSAGRYYLVAEAFRAGREGALEVTLSTGSVNTPEICDNGFDDDGDGAVDCEDVDCAASPACQNQLCQADLNLGAVVVDGPAAVGQLSTVNAGDDQQLNCAAGGGQDVVFRFSLPEPSGVVISVSQTGDHVVGLFSDGGPGTRCEAGRGGCIDLQGQAGPINIVAGNRAAGVYYIIVDAQSPGREGNVTVTVQAFGNRGRELCNNGIDDDGNGLVDCDDPACEGVLGCAGALCSPDENLGTLAPGDSTDFDVDTTDGGNDQRLTCAAGGGEDRVVQFQLTELSDLLVQCMETGDNVMGLFVAGGPRDRCDVNQRNCADLGPPLGCNFIFPGLFPGNYFLIMQAFTPGSEGQVSGTLSALPIRTLEICDNGIDDDGDGLTDCDDPNCAGFPACAAQTCVPDQRLGFLAIDGAARNVAFTTQGAGADQQVSCATSPGGEDRVVGFTLSRTADVRVDFGQFGNHDFALFRDGGQGRRCDAQPVDCRASGGVQNGQLDFAALPAGAYYLVTKADAPAAEGSVVLRLQATSP